MYDVDVRVGHFIDRVEGGLYVATDTCANINMDVLNDERDSASDIAVGFSGLL